jgi:hypothetical protein
MLQMQTNNKQNEVIILLLKERRNINMDKYVRYINNILKN